MSLQTVIAPIDPSYTIPRVQPLHVVAINPRLYPGTTPSYVPSTIKKNSNVYMDEEGTYMFTKDIIIHVFDVMEGLFIQLSNGTREI